MERGVRSNGPLPVEEVKERESLERATSQKIRNMSFLCALLVVCQHTSVAAWCSNHIFILTRIAVPFFFCVSGYFFVAHMDSAHWYREAIRKRIRTLAIPYLIFTAIWAVIKLSLSEWFSVQSLFTAFGLNLTYWPIVGALWYIRDLFLYALLVPLLTPLLTRSFGLACVTLMFFAMLSMLTHYIAYTTEDERLMSFLRWGFSAMGLFWFSSGVAIRRWVRSSRPCYLMFVGAAVVGIWYFILPPELNSWIGAVFYPLSTACVMYVCWHLVPAGRWPLILVGNTFPLYLMHWQVGHSMAWLARSLIGSLSAGVCFALFLSTIVVCIFGAQFLRTVAPKFANVAFGGR